MGVGQGAGLKPLVSWASHCGWGKSLWDLRNMLWVGLTERVRCGCEVRGVWLGRKTPLWASQVPQGLLVQGAVEAVDLLLAVLPDGVQAGATAHHLEHVAAGSRGAH